LCVNKSGCGLPHDVQGIGGSPSPEQVLENRHIALSHCSVEGVALIPARGIQAITPAQ